MRTTPVIAPPPHRTTGRAALLLGLCSGVLSALVLMRWGPLIATDRSVARASHRWAVAEPALTRVCRVLSDRVWDPWTMRLLAAAVAVWLLWRYAARRTAAWLAVTCLLATLVQQWLKAAVGRARPVWPDPVDSAHYAAFPSGHAMTATVVCGLLLWLLAHHGAPRDVRRVALGVAVVSVVGVGLTRVWLGVHWMSDVVGGWLLGALTVVCAVQVHRRWVR
ncbi:phosphatase PAP2 family protein [Streptomyces sp. XM83C]|jgi:undecaprenyl-diphosphatase|uniref:Phosphatase PAP2 family protein n=1 Tax=Streptomyces thermocoprophilus TaxID=78356 RepID=A0ABV5V8M3_9ACTN|nr:phosphatase PAP2 family protein [Streptomyces sp. XM83C]MCK1818725.1 phosphatase PAP2 family protein [Streptomyces sp. XM83C]